VLFFISVEEYSGKGKGAQGIKAILQRFIFAYYKGLAWKVLGEAESVPTRKKTFSLDKASGICYCANLRKSLIFKHLRGAPPTPTQVVDIQGVTW
jgi:hypothetical protein